MNEEKLTSDKVPQKFAEWLLSMGCPSNKVPSVDKLGEMCRGQYYMVWRSLMEHVEPKDTIRLKRLQVFNDDVQRCQKRNAFCKPDSSVVVPEELSLWKQQTELREKLQDTEARVLQARQQCDELVDKVSSKLSHRNLSRVRVQDAQRRAWLLQQVADELRNKKDNLMETRSIADSICCIDSSVDIEGKLDKCTTLRRQNSRGLSSSMSTNSQVSITSNNGDFNDSEEYLSLVKCSGEALWPQLCERRAALTAALNITNVPEKTTDTNRVSPQWVLSNTASLHCSLALDALKNRAHIEHTRAKLANALTQLNDYLSGESCELLVVRSEHARADARLHSLRALLDDVTGQHGAFATSADGNTNTNSGKQINVIDKAIESKRDELRRVITSLALTERKIQNVRECLITVFNSFHTEGYSDTDRFGGQLSMPQESISTLRRFYEEKREKRRNKMELSLDLDTSDNCSYNDGMDLSNPKFIDELKVYLKKFSLEKNRKLVLESGEKIWIFETLQSSIERLHTRLQDHELSCPIVCPADSLSANLLRLVNVVETREQLTELLKELEGRQRNDLVIDITSHAEEEQNTIDKIKKRLNENLQSLQKTIKTLDMGQENLKLWSDNSMRKYIAPSRTIDGRSYKDYESYYVENLTL
ncbi:dim gamma-tubulin 5 [Anticarsia gemmatalis]|uniref:dim gamma-tubulin 5 n=1 Tax=Anticarsia gemmatalis TaxID=129554 RepID=UPI003F76A8E6